jgi:hypothetical protein
VGSDGRLQEIADHGEISMDSPTELANFIERGVKVISPSSSGEPESAICCSLLYQTYLLVAVLLLLLANRPIASGHRCIRHPNVLRPKRRDCSGCESWYERLCKYWYAGVPGGEIHAHFLGPWRRMAWIRGTDTSVGGSGLFDLALVQFRRCIVAALARRVRRIYI